MRFRLHAEALAEYVAAAERYEKQVPGLGERFESS